MTTIVCNRTSMAADKRVTGGPMFKTTKIFRINGSLIGFCGSLEASLQFVEWRRTPDTKPEFGENSSFEALELSADGRLTYWASQLVAMAIEDDFYAIGSGASLALGAMAMGASPKRAISVAALYDSGTGSDVQTLTLAGK